jgi:PhzF family phenazine biosynthesis protein
MRQFSQVDVFTDEFTKGNALAVVHDADGLSTEEMAAFANWTNLSETTFLLRPTVPAADYRVRIFTTARELPFAGHPTIGSARAWLAAGGKPHSAGELVQECGAGLVRLRHSNERLAFAAPPLVRSGPVDEVDLAQVVHGLRLSREDVVDAQWCSNGPDWMALLLRDADAVLKVEPDSAGFGAFTDIGIVGPYPSGSDVAFEVRALVADAGVWEDPVTGSLNAGIAQWLIGAGIAPPSYLAAQGTRLGRKGRVHVEQADGEIWIGGESVIGIRGTVEI